MLELTNSWLGHWEPIWLLIVLLVEAVYSKLGHSATKEFYKFLIQQKRLARRKKMDFEDLNIGEGR